MQMFMKDMYILVVYCIDVILKEISGIYRLPRDSLAKYRRTEKLKTVESGRIIQTDFVVPGNVQI